MLYASDLLEFESDRCLRLQISSLWKIEVTDSQYVKFSRHVCQVLPSPTRYVRYETYLPVSTVPVSTSWRCGFSEFYRWLSRSVILCLTKENSYVRVSSSTLDIVHLFLNKNGTSLKMLVLPSKGRKGEIIHYFYWKVLIRANGFCPLTGIIFTFQWTFQCTFRPYAWRLKYNQL